MNLDVSLDFAQKLWCSELIYDGAYLLLGSGTTALVVDCATGERFGITTVERQGPRTYGGVCVSLDSRANVVWVHNWQQYTLRFFFDVAAKKLLVERRNNRRYYAELRGAYAFTFGGDSWHGWDLETDQRIRTNDIVAKGFPICMDSPATKMWIKTRDRSQFETRDRSQFELYDIATGVVLASVRNASTRTTDGASHYTAFVDFGTSEWCAIRDDCSLSRTRMYATDIDVVRGNQDVLAVMTHVPPCNLEIRATRTGELFFSVPSRSFPGQVRLSRKSIFVHHPDTDQLVIYETPNVFAHTLLVVLSERRWARFFCDADGDHFLASIISSL